MSDTTVYQPDLLYTEGRFHPGRALRVGPDGRVAPEAPLAPGERVVRLAGRALLPGLVNGHSHAFQRLIRGRTEYVAAGHASDDFWSWREAMYRAAEALSPEDVYTASRQAFLEMALCGVTTVGEFHYLHHQPDGTPYTNRNELALQVVRAARDVGLRIVLLRVGYARAGFGVAHNPRQRRFLDARVEDFLSAAEALAHATRGDSAVGVGLAPHSVRAVPRAWLEALAGRRGGPLHMHVAEQPKEIEACLAEHGRRPVQLLADVGLLGPHFTAVHGVHLTDEEVGLLGAAGVTVCACPSTERNLGDGVVPADALLRAGARVSLGSDSQATVDLLDEARQLEGHLRLWRLRRAVLDEGSGAVDGLAARLLAMATVEGARSLGLAEVGALRPGAPADFFTVDLTHPSLVGASPESLLAGVVFGADKAAVREVAVDGRLVVDNGCHASAEQTGRAFQQLAWRLYRE